MTHPKLDELLSLWEKRENDGEVVTAEDLCRDCPELLPDLQERIAALRSMNAVLRTVQSADTPGTAGRSPSTEGSAPSTQSSYRILRSHARGGLGEVFVAFDETLQREVALKSMRAVNADSQSKERFLWEAAITSRLEHPGIVPVYGRGEERQGQPCYAMRFVRGETLQDAIRRLHSSDGGPAFRRELRSLLGRFVTVCNAVAYAHSQGIVHRDLKPANIMLGKYGETLVVDWGLAKLTCAEDASRAATNDQSICGEAGSLTQEGIVLGTPAYMSPEQAAGDSAIGPASDVHGLGGVLYAILCDHAPQEGDSIYAILERAKKGLVKPPRSWRSDVPPPLEAACLKALAPRPEERYATPLDLAAEIERWLAGEPVLAYPEPWTMRFQRWVRRRQAWVTAAAVILVTAVIGLGVGTVFLRKEQRLTSNALEQAKTNEAEARQQERIALANFKMAREAVDEYATKVGTDPRLKGHDLEPLRKQLLQSSVAFYRRFAEIASADPEIRAEQGRAYRRLADITRQIAPLSEALPLLAEGIETFERLAREYPDVAEYPLQLADLHLNLSTLTMELGKTKEAEAATRKALALYDNLAARHPGAAPYREGQGRARNQLGKQAQATGNVKDAEAEYERAIALMTALSADHPEAPLYGSLLADYYDNLAALLRRAGRNKEAEETFRRAGELLSNLASAHPDDATLQSDLAHHHFSFALFRRANSNPTEAVASMDKSIALYKKLADSHPAILDHQARLARAYYNKGLALRDLARLDDAEASYRLAMTAFEKLTKLDPAALEHRNGLANCHNTIGGIYYTRRMYGEAAKEQMTAQAMVEQIANEHPNLLNYRISSLGFLANVSHVLADSGEPDKARAALDRALDGWRELRRKHPTDMSIATEYGGNLVDLSELIDLKGDYPEALRVLEEGRKELQAVLAIEPKNNRALRKLTNSQAMRAGYHARAGKHADALRDLDQTLAAYGEGPYRQEYLAQRAYNLAMLGDFEKARREITALVGAAKIEPKALYELGRAHAALAAMDSKSARVDADAAMRLLRRAKDDGYLTSPADREILLKDKDFQVLRDRPDFQKLLAELPRKPNP